MAIKNVTLTWNFFAYDTGNSVGKTGDSGNFTLKIIKDGGTPATPDNSITEPDSTNLPGVYEIVLTATEMDANLITLAGKSSTANIVISPVSIPTEQGTIAIIDAIVDAILVDTAVIGDLGAGLTALKDIVWDEPLTGATHNVATSAGKRLRQVEAAFVLHSGTAQAATSTTLTLDSGASTIDNFYLHQRVVITDGTGIEQVRVIIQYVGSTRVATIVPAWKTNPNSASVFEIEPAAGHSSGTNQDLQDGYAQAGASLTITLSSEASSVDDFYNGEGIVIHAGTGAGQHRDIEDYVGSTRIATVSSAWNTNPDTTSHYVIIGQLEPEVITSHLWNSLLVDHTVSGSFGEDVQAHALSSEISSLNNISTAQVNTEADAALADIELDHLMSASATGANVADNSIIAQLVSKESTADFDDFVKGTDSLQAIGEKTSATSGGAPIDTGTAQAGTSTTLTLRAGAPSVNQAGSMLSLVGGTGDNQLREILSYDTGTKVATVSTWDVTPDGTTAYEILAALSVNLTVSGGGLGPGADEVTIVFTETASGDPIGDADVWIATDAAMTNVIAGFIRTNGAGKATFLLDDGVSYYYAIQKDGIKDRFGIAFTAVAD